MPGSPPPHRPTSAAEERPRVFDGTYDGLPVIVTGHTGFKGGWLCWWLHRLGARVTGLGLPPATTPSLFRLLGLESRLSHHLVDLRDAEEVHRVVQQTRPRLVFHLAAQALVRRSYAEPRLTWETNLVGTLNLLEALRTCPSVAACVVVTTDKCYENLERSTGYRETDALGGHDPYSASKAAVEILVSSTRRSFLSEPGRCRLASARAGNVLGGGDWGADRVVPDLVASLVSGDPVVLRNPSATRPWQHVLDCSSGYLRLGQCLLGADGDAFAEAWNFGPPEGAETTVAELVRRLQARWGGAQPTIQTGPAPVHEAGRLALDVTKARERLGWESAWDLDATLGATAEWYRVQHEGGDVRALTDAQIDAYVEAARIA